MSFTATVSVDASGTLTSGTPKNESFAATGEGAWLNFTATAGETVALNIGSISTTPASTSYTVTVYNSSGASVGSTSSASGATLNLTNLAAGTYSVLITPATPATGSMQVTLAPEAGGTLSTTSSGSGAPYSTSVPGQNAYFTFSGAAAQSLSLALTSFSLTPSSVSGATITVTGPGSYYASGYCYENSGSCEIPLKNLPATGTYSVTVTPGGMATMSFTTTLSVDATGSLTAGTAQGESFTATGEGAWLSFTATASQTVALNIGSISTSPASTSYTVTVYNSSGTSVGSGSSASGTTLNLTGLAAGTYNVLITPAAPATGSMQVTLEAQTGGALSTTSSGSGTSYTTPVPGQNAYFTFSGAAAQSLSLALTSFSLTPSSVSGATITVTGPGSYYASGYCYENSGSCEIPLKNLPGTGTYSVTVAPSGMATMSFTTTLSADVTGTITTSAQGVTLAATGQAAWMNFTATSGQNVPLAVASISATPSGTSYTITAYNSSGTSVGSTSTSTGTTLNLNDLAAGTYYVLITPAAPATASMQVSY